MKTAFHEAKITLMFNISTTPQAVSWGNMVMLRIHAAKSSIVNHFALRCLQQYAIFLHVKILAHRDTQPFSCDV